MALQDRRRSRRRPAQRRRRPARRGARPGRRRPRPGPSTEGPARRPPSPAASAASRSSGVSRSSASGPPSSRCTAPAARAAAAWAAREPSPKRNGMLPGGTSRSTFVPVPARSGTTATSARSAAPGAAGASSAAPALTTRRVSSATPTAGRSPGTTRIPCAPAAYGPGAGLVQPLVQAVARLRHSHGPVALRELQHRRVRRDDDHRLDARGGGRGVHRADQEPRDERPALLRVEDLAEARLGALEAPDGHEGDESVEARRLVGHGSIVDEVALGYRTCRNDDRSGTPPPFTHVSRPRHDADRDRGDAHPHRPPGLRAPADPAARREPPGSRAAPRPRRGADLASPCRPPTHPVAAADRPRDAGDHAGRGRAPPARPGVHAGGGRSTGRHASPSARCG